MTVSLAPYVPSSDDVVTRMLEVARVNRDDVVFDLGCGDGRILFSAVKKFRAKRVVGYEMQEDLYQGIVEKIKAERLEHRMKVFNEDALTADLSEATVVTLYLTTSGNSKLKPKLSTAQLGTRIVSHDFRIDGWNPTRREDFRGHTIYLYTLPDALSPQTESSSQQSLFSRNHRL
jgi:tRNA G37 N-methylase Trm5